LGKLFTKKNATALVIDNVDKADLPDLQQLQAYAREQYNDKYEDVRKLIVRGVLGNKAQARLHKRQRAVQREAETKTKAGVA